MGDGGQHVFDGMDALVDHQLAEVVVIVRVLTDGRVVAGSRVLRLRLLGLQLDVLGRAPVALQTAFAKLSEPR